MAANYRCAKCDKRIDEKDAHPPTDPLERMHVAYPDEWPREIGPQRNYHTVHGWHFHGAPGAYGASTPFTADCGPLREEGDGDAYIDWAMAKGGA